jgi:hypothetical protein
MNMWYVKIKSMVFYYKVPTIFIFPQNCVSKNPFPFSQNSPFWAILNHIIMVLK